MIYDHSHILIIYYSFNANNIDDASEFVYKKARMLGATAIVCKQQFKYQ